MGGLRLRYQTVEIGDEDIHLRTLRDRTQFADDDGAAAAVGISSAAWPLFGVVWDASRVLARLVAERDLRGRRVLEVGCGIALPSLLLARRGVDVTATDHNPAVAGFLAANAALNDTSVRFVRADWADVDPGLGRFDTVLGSDVLYEHEHVDLLAGFVDRHAAPACEVLLVDAGRGHTGRFSRRMAELGYAASRAPIMGGAEAPGFRGHLLAFVRGGGPPGVG